MDPASHAAQLKEARAAIGELLTIDSDNTRREHRRLADRESAYAFIEGGGVQDD